MHWTVYKQPIKTIHCIVLQKKETTKKTSLPRPLVTPRWVSTVMLFLQCGNPAELQLNAIANIPQRPDNICYFATINSHVPRLFYFSSSIHTFCAWTRILIVFMCFHSGLTLFRIFYNYLCGVFLLKKPHWLPIVSAICARLHG